MRTTLGLVIALTLVAAAGAADGITLSCGQTLGPSSGTFYLDDDVGPCDGVGAAITLIGPVRLDLNGHTVSCQDADANGQVAAGITLQGPQALVRNGSVSGCSVAVSVIGDRNRVANVSVSNSGGNAIVVGGSFNVLTRNPVEHAGGIAFEVIGDRNLLHENVARQAAVGFSLAGDYNNLRGNIADFNQGDGFWVMGQRPTLVSNTAMFNLGLGFWMLPSGCILHSNVAWANEREGFVVQSSGCILRGNSANDNLYGIVAGGFDNAMIFNSAHGNEWIDLVDVNGDCTANIWRDNSFGTKEPDCIQ